jgi:cytochrome c6
MKIILKYFLQFFFFLFFFPQNVNASNLEEGKKLFFYYCNTCHIENNNKILPEKNLKKENLKLYGIENLDDIIYQITNGKNGMPAFSLRLTNNEIKSIAMINFLI